MDLIFLRHGQTDWNIQHRLQGRSDIPLNSVGKYSAAEVAKVLKGYSFGAVYCSPLLRARQTAETACPGVEFISDERLIEWNFGSLEGTNSLDNELYHNMWHLGMPRVSGAEVFEEVMARAEEFYRQISSEFPNETILAVSHGGVSAALQAVLRGCPENGDLYSYVLPNTTPVLFRDGQAPIILKENTL